MLSDIDENEVIRHALDFDMLFEFMKLLVSGRNFYQSPLITCSVTLLQLLVRTNSLDRF